MSDNRKPGTVLTETDRQHALKLIADLRTRYLDKALDELLFMFERLQHPAPEHPLFGMLNDGRRFRRVDGQVTRTYTVTGFDVRNSDGVWIVIFRSTRSDREGADRERHEIPLVSVFAHIVQGDLRPLADGET